MIKFGVKRILFLFSVFSVIISCIKKADKQTIIVKNTDSIKSETVVFLNYGMIIPGYALEIDSVKTKKFGFIIKNVAGCEVTDALLYRIKTNNETSNLKMKTRYGNNWQLDFEKTAKMKLGIPNIE